MKRLGSSLLMAALLAVFVLALGRSASALQPGESPGDDDGVLAIYRDVIVRALDEAKRIGTQCIDCGTTWAGRQELRSPMCQATYEHIYEKEVVDMRMVLGYQDDGDAVEDRYQAAAMIDQITKACDGTTQTCGFQHTDDGELFIKRMQGPDGRMKTIQLRVTHSSASDSDKRNRKDLEFFQQQQSERAERAFFDGLRSADVVVYNGHARKGGGPDFEKARKTKAGRIDYPWYQKNKQSWKRIVDTLKSTPQNQQPKLIGLIACDAQRLYGNDLRKAAPNTALALAGPNSVFESGFAQAFATIDNVLNMRCEDKFEKVMNAQEDFSGFHPSKAKLEGFFRPGTVPRSYPGAGTRYAPSAGATNSAGEDPNVPSYQGQPSSPAAGTLSTKPVRLTPGGGAAGYNPQPARYQQPQQQPQQHQPQRPQPLFVPDYPDHTK